MELQERRNKVGAARTALTNAANQADIAAEGALQADEPTLAQRARGVAAQVSYAIEAADEALAGLDAEEAAAAAAEEAKAEAEKAAAAEAAAAEKAAKQADE